jgi:hypothetical protein
VQNSAKLSWGKTFTSKDAALQAAQLIESVLQVVVLRKESIFDLLRSSTQLHSG